MTLAADTFASPKRSTRPAPPSAKLAAYRDVLKTTGNFEVEAIDEEFDFTANAMTLPGLGVAHIASSAVRVARTAETAADDGRDIALAVFHEGTVTTTQGGREVTLNGGGAYLFSSHDPLLMQRSASRLRNYSLLRRDLAPAVANLDGALMKAIPVDSEPIRLLTGYTDLLFGNRIPASAESRRLAVRHIHDLIALAVGATREATEAARGRGLRAARHADLYARAGRLIALRFDEPDLKPEAIARQIGVSSRLLHKMFAARGETVMTRLWNERLSCAERLLCAPEAADRSITDIAFACGFNDSSHFGRVFAERKGMAPSQWRKRSQDLAADTAGSHRH